MRTFGRATDGPALFPFLMTLVEAPLPGGPRDGEKVVRLDVDRRTLAKRRWRGTAGDGMEFGFDLHHGLAVGSVVHRADGKCYVIAQAPEEVLEIEPPTDPQQAVALAWQIGNLHFPLQVDGGRIRTADDPALRQMFDRAGIVYESVHAVFEPLAAVTGHGHHHHHEH